MYISRAIKKYGAENFRFEVLKDGLSKEEAEGLEIELISKLKPEYNLTSGGRGTPGLRWTQKQRDAFALTHSEIVQRAIERIRRPVICLDSGEIYRSIKDAELALGAGGLNHALRLNGRCGGKQFAYYHREFSEEERQHLRRTVRTKFGHQTTNRAVICLNDGVRYPSAVEAAKAYNIRKPWTVGFSCQNRSQTKYGLQFCYADEPIREFNHAYRQQKIEKFRATCARMSRAKERPVICLNDGAVYKSSAQASRTLSKYSNVVWNAVSKQTNYAGKYFAYYEGPLAESERIEKLNAMKKQDIPIGRSPVVCLVDMKHYRSLRAAAKAYGVSHKVVGLSCKQGIEIGNGLRFAYHTPNQEAA